MKRVSVRFLLITLILPLSMLTAIAAVSICCQVSVSAFTRDPLAIAKVHPLTGVLSNLGNFLWCAAASICFFTASVLYIKRSEAFGFLLFSGFLSAYLLFDVFFQFHEYLAPRHLGLDDKIVYMALGIMVLVYLIVFRRILQQTNYGILLLSAAFLFLSLSVDAIFGKWLSLDQLDSRRNIEFLLEDGAQFMGITCLCSYFAYTSRQLIIDAFGPTQKAAHSKDLRAVVGFMGQ